MDGSPGNPPARQKLGRTLLRGTLTGLVLGFLLQAVYVLVGPNYHTVIPGLVYRCAQPSPRLVASLVRRKGIHTIVNLRGCCDPLAWYIREGQAASQHNISLEDLGFSAGRLPSVPALRQLVDIFDHSEYPLLLHCHKGSDRTGMASAIALLLKTGATVEQARGQLSWRYGHLPIGRTTNIDRFFDLYEEWLQTEGLTHTAESFHRWAMQEYCPAECRCRIELLKPAPEPLHIPFTLGTALPVRCWNTSVKPWRLHPDNNAGIHLGFWISDKNHKSVGEGRAGLFHATVPPGGFIDLTIAVPPLLPGSYDLRADMMDEQHALFLQTGSEPFFCKLEVP